MVTLSPTRRQRPPPKFGPKRAYHSVDEPMAAWLSARPFDPHILPMMIRIALIAALLLGAGAAEAQVYDHNTGEFGGPGEPDGGPSDAAATTTRIDRLERDIRRLTGQNEELQHKVQTLEEQLRAAREGGAARPADPAAATARPTAPPPSGSVAAPALPPASPPPESPQPTPGRRGDAFDPASDPTAPGAPRPIGTTAPSAPLTTTPKTATGAVTTAPPAREVGQPLDIAHGRLVGDQTATAPDVAPAPAAVAGPREEYDEAVATLKAGKFEAAEKSLEAFLTKNPKSKFTPAATFNLGETFFLRGRHREAAEKYLEISQKYAQSAQAPDALLRLGQSLGAMGAKEQACASFNEIGVKYPGSAARIRDAAQRESKKLQC